MSAKSTLTLQEQLSKVAPLLRAGREVAGSMPSPTHATVEFPPQPGRSQPASYEIMHATPPRQGQQNSPYRKEWDGTDRRTPTTANLKIVLPTGATVFTPLSEEQAKKFVESSEKTLKKAETGATVNLGAQVVALILGVLSIIAAGGAIYMGARSRAKDDPHT